MSKQAENGKETKELQSGVLLGKYSCPECLSQDNLLVYVKHNEVGSEYAIFM